MKFWMIIVVLALLLTGCGGPQAAPDIQSQKTSQPSKSANAGCGTGADTAGTEVETSQLPTVTIHASCGEKVRVLVEIADNGCGIPEHLKQRVLEPYFSTKKEGTGLGLAIVNQIVSDHGGYLRIADNQPIGTVIIIELPCHEAKHKRGTHHD